MEAVLRQAREVASGRARPALPAGTALRVGVDLGTAYTVLFVLDDDGVPVAGGYRWAEVVRDGVVLDFGGAVALVTALRAAAEEVLGVELDHAAVTVPPGVPATEVRAHRFVVEAAGLDCTAVVDEPTAANAVLQVRDGAVVDVGGGTTGIAVLQDGRVVSTADEPTGGTHVSLVIAGSRRVPFEEAERLKQDPALQPELLPVVRPVFEKVATIVADHLAQTSVPVDRLWLVGGTAAFPGVADIVQQVTGLPTVVPTDPLFVTPLGVAHHDVAHTPGRGG
ncbi:MAG: ethanolamine utilization protein EutJ [Actinotalea sp.]|nr:ethanolamine utilization protein EutJ [Actinotalea sp.]